MKLRPALLCGFPDFHSHQQGGGFFSLQSLCSIYCHRFSMLTMLTCEVMPLLTHNSLVLIHNEHLFTCFMAISMFFLEKRPFKSCDPIWLGCFFDIEMHKLFVCFGEKFLVGVSVRTYLFHYGVCLFVMCMASFAVPVLLRGVRSHLFLSFSFVYFCFIFHDSKR